MSSQRNLIHQDFCCSVTQAGHLLHFPLFFSDQNHLKTVQVNLIFFPKGERRISNSMCNKYFHWLKTCWARNLQTNKMPQLNLVLGIPIIKKMGLVSFAQGLSELIKNACSATTATFHCSWGCLTAEIAGSSILCKMQISVWVPCLPLFPLIEGTSFRHFLRFQYCLFTTRQSEYIFSSPVRSTRRAIVVTPVVHVCVCVCVCVCVPVPVTLR